MPLRPQANLVLALAPALLAASPQAVPAAPADLRQAAQHVVYAFENSGPGLYRAVNPAQHLALEFGNNEARLTSSESSVAVRLTGYGYGAALRTPPPAAPAVSGNRIDYHRGDLTEWYVNDARGLEQGFTIAHRPGSPRNGEPLVVALALKSGLRPERAAQSDAILLRSSTEEGLRYAGLRAWDARGRGLSAHLQLAGREIQLQVDDRDAAYPLIIDPLWSQLAILTASNGAAGDNFGFSVALNATTALVGAPAKNVNANQGQGAAYVFVLANGTWTQQAELLASDGAAGDSFGYSVALNGDTAVVGAYAKTAGANSLQGAAYVFVRSGATWTQQQKLTASDAAANDYFGFSVAVSGDTALIGAPDKNMGFYHVQGVAYAFVRSGTSWTEQQELVSSDALPGDFFGGAVALDGNTAAIGAYKKVAAFLDQGAAYIFVRSGASWTQQADLLAPDGAPNGEFGSAVSVSGLTAVIGAQHWKSPFSGTIQNGAAYIFVQSGTSWPLQDELFANSGPLPERFGSVSVSGDTLVFSSAPDPSAGSGSGQGEFTVYTRTGGNWSPQQTVPVPYAQDQSGFGLSVSVDGSTAVVGAPFRTIGSNTTQGAAYVFGPPAGMPYTFLQFPDGSVGIWTLGVNGRQLSIAASTFPAGPSSGITLVNGADLNADGTPDLVLQFSNGSIGVWYMNGTDSISGFAFLSGPIQGWKLAAIGDLNGDGKPDFVLQNSDGSIGVWYRGGTTGHQIVGFAPISGPLADWKLVGVGDLNGDGHLDAVIQRTDGTVGVWYLGGTQGNQITGFSVVAGPSNWSVVGVADINGEHHPDLMIRNSDGTLGVWFLGGPQANPITGFAPITTPGNIDWREMGVH